MNIQLLTADDGGEYLDRIQRDIANAEYFVLVTAFATSAGISLLEPAMQTCLKAGGQGTIVLALDNQHFNAADLFQKLASLVECYPKKLAVRIVHEGSGFLHAKAVYARLQDGNATLLVGSANLTKNALTQNRELGLWVDLLGNPEISRSFVRFADRLGGEPCDAEKLRNLAKSLGPRVRVTPGNAGGVSPELPVMPVDPRPLDIPIETFVGDWMGAGSIVGRGREGLDVLVMRVPAEQLEQRGLIDRESKERITRETERTLSASYRIRLLPDEEDERLRKDSRKTRRILAKLTLNMPCFGFWMPKCYWDVFQRAVAKVQEGGVTPEALFDAAESRRHDLDGAGLERQVDAISDDLVKSNLANLDRRAELRAELLQYFREQLAQRTPELISRAGGFRTQRQSLSSDLDLQSVARSFFVDIIQATFAATYRSGRWPQKFHSIVGRQLASRIQTNCLSEIDRPSDAFAVQLLDSALTWEDERRGFDSVTAEVNRLIGEAGEFLDVKIDELLQTLQEGGDDGDND